LPFSFVSAELLWWVFSAFSFALLAFVLAVSRRRIRYLAAVPLLIVSYPIWSNFQQGNYTALMLFAAVAMAVFLSRGLEFWAGVCWMLLMIKPQIGLPFAIPLAIRMRVVTGSVAVLLCLALSVPAILLCDPQLPKFFYEAAEASSFAFEGCGTFPKFLCGFFENGVGINIGLAVGAALCAWMTWMLRREKDWIVYLMPAAICSSCWTYTQAFSHAMGWFVVYAIVVEMIRRPHSRFLWLLFALSVPVLSRAFLAWHGFCKFFGVAFPMSEYMFRCMDSINSTLSLALAFAYCLIRSGRFEKISSVEVSGVAS
jgi:hypothetical protein